MPKIDVTTSADRMTMTITLPYDPPVKLTLDAGHADKFIEALINSRAQMLPEHPPELAPGQQVTVITDPRWVNAQDALGGGSILHLRDPRVGWLHYLFPRHEAAHLGKLMVAQSETPVTEISATAH